jgi:hypothetical protein
MVRKLISERRVKLSFLHVRRALAAWAVGLLLSCSAERDAPFSGHDAVPLTLMAQRVTASVRKQAATLVRIETDREVFVTTPEHPFAAPEAGWIPAGQLAPGDRVVSARFGTARVLSARKEKPSQPVPVFNLTVDRSHAYLVGADQVLVHNTGCEDTKELAKKRAEELREKQSELKALLKPDGASSSQQTPENSKKIADLKDEIKKIRQSIYYARNRLKNAGIKLDLDLELERGPIAAPKQRPTGADAITQRKQQIEKIDQEIAKLEKELPSSSDKADTQQRIQKLYKERQTINKRLYNLQWSKRKRTGEGATDDVPGVPGSKRAKAPDLSRDARLRWLAEKDFESAETGLEATRKKLHELAALPVRTEDERRAAETRKAELEKLLKKQEPVYEFAKRILDWEKQVATINETLKIDRNRPDLVAQRKQLRADISAERDRLHERKRRGTAGFNERRRAIRGRLQRTVTRMRQELAQLRAQPDTPSNAERIIHLGNAVKTGDALIEARRQIHSIGVLLSNARKKRGDQVKNGEDTSAIVQTIAKLEEQLTRQRAERTRLHAQALLLGLVQAQRRRPLDNEDAAHLQEVRGMLDDPATLDAGRLAEIARDTEDTVRGEPDTLDDAFFDEIWGSGNPDDAPDAARQEPVSDDFETLDEELQAMLHSLLEPDSAAAPEPGSPVERTDPRGDSGEAGPSNDPVERNTQLRLEWQREIEERLVDTRDQLEILQMLGDYRNEELEAQLLQRIAGLEKSLQNPPF